VSRAPFANIESYRKRMGWPHRRVSSANNNFNSDFGMTTAEEERHGLSVFHFPDVGHRYSFAVASAKVGGLCTAGCGGERRRLIRL
jgi:predicted dithiol-disulfide oxidoreductase (DUF899 family)